MTAPRRPAGDQPLRGSPGPLATSHDAVLLDLDGTVYVGPDAVPGAVDVVAAVRARGAACCFLTNNASRPASAVAAHLRTLGLPAEAGDVVTSAQAAARLLAAGLPRGAAVLVVGGDGLQEAVREAGLRPVPSADDAPAAVVQGFAPEVGWRQLTEGVIAVRRGLPWVASNRDLTFPTPRGPAPGNGSLVEVIRLVTGREPQVAGKPERPLLDAAITRTGARTPLVVGDRLDTDIACAARAGVPSLLVLTGVTDAGLLLRAVPGERPTYVAADLDGLLSPHPPVEPGPAGGWTCRGWTASVDGRVLLLRPAEGAGGDPHDGLRAACAAAWEAHDRWSAGVSVEAALAVLGL